MQSLLFISFVTSRYIFLIIRQAHLIKVTLQQLLFRLFRQRDDLDCLAPSFDVF